MRINSGNSILIVRWFDNDLLQLVIVSTWAGIKPVDNVRKEI